MILVVLSILRTALTNSSPSTPEIEIITKADAKANGLRDKTGDAKAITMCHAEIGGASQFELRNLAEDGTVFDTSDEIIENVGVDF